MAIHEFYEIDSNKVIKKRQTCPRCGPGVFLADHRTRLTCGRCGYTEFKR